MRQPERETVPSPWDRHEDRRPLLDRGPREPARRYRGERVKGAILTEGDVRVIRELWALGVSQRTIARAYRVSQPTVCLILRREKWAHIPASDRERTELACQVETTMPPLATTGRVQRWTGLAWETFPDMRRAEVATGIDRLDIAAACLCTGSGWRYEPGLPPEPQPDLW